MFMFGRVCLFLLDFYALFYYGLDSQHIKCVLRGDKTKKTVLYGFVCDKSLKNRVTMRKSNPGIRLPEDTPIIKEHAQEGVS